MGTTSKGYRYPEATDPPDGPLSFKNLADDANKSVPTLDAAGSAIAGVKATGAPPLIYTYRTFATTDSGGHMSIQMPGKFSCVTALHIIPLNSAVNFYLDSANSAGVNTMIFIVTAPSGTVLANFALQYIATVIGWGQP